MPYLVAPLFGKQIQSSRKNQKRVSTKGFGKLKETILFISFNQEGNKHLRKILANEVRRLTIGGVIITIGYGVLSYYVASQFDSVC